MSQPPSPSINIKIKADELDLFCQKILNRSRDITKTHDALITLESFICLFARSSHGTAEYEAIESSIKKVTESSRSLLLQHNTNKLIHALKQCDIQLLANIHTPLSRNGFYQILQTSIEQLSDDEIRLCMLWSSAWLDESKKLAEKASGYPDAMDFKKANISIEQFQAMNDIDRVLNTQ